MGVKMGLAKDRNFASGIQGWCKADLSTYLWCVLETSKIWWPWNRDTIGYTSVESWNWRSLEWDRSNVAASTTVWVHELCAPNSPYRGSDWQAIGWKWQVPLSTAPKRVSQWEVLVIYADGPSYAWASTNPSEESIHGVRNLRLKMFNYPIAQPWSFHWQAGSNLEISLLHLQPLQALSFMETSALYWQIQVN